MVARIGLMIVYWVMTVYAEGDELYAPCGGMFFKRKVYYVSD